MNYKMRADNLIQQMKASGIDAVVVSSMPNIRYFSGFTGDSGVLVISSSSLSLMTDFRYREQAKEQAPNYAYIEFNSENPMWRCVNDIFSSSAKVIGFEAENMLFSEYNQMVEATGDMDWVDVSSTMAKLRSIKDADELDNMREAGRIGDRVFAQMLEMIKPGISEIDIAVEIEYRLRKEGAEAKSFDPIIASGFNGSKPHAIPSNKIIATGELITLDFGALFNGYCSDMTRTIAVGDLAEELISVYNTVLKAQVETCEKVRGGMTGKEVDSIARNIITEAGYGQNFGHGLGHSLGIQIHENPRYSPMYDGAVESGTCMTIEPGIYLDGKFGIRIEDFGLVTDKGFESFSHSPKELIHL